MNAGPGLMFVTLPNVFDSMAGGQIAVYSNDTAENGTEVVFTEEDMDAISGEVPNVKAVTTVLEFQRKRHRQKGNL